MATGLDDIVEICDYWEFLDHYFVWFNLHFFSFRNLNVVNVPHDYQIVKN